jgi:Uma2 family endonuclease
MTNPLVRADGSPWTIDDLEQLPDDGNRYELFDGSLLVSPHARVRHGGVAHRLRRLLEAQAPTGTEIAQDLGVEVVRRTTYYVPDIVVVPASAFDADDEAYLAPADVRLAIEVLSPGNKGRDLVLKRHDYAQAGIRHYWIVDPDTRTLTVLRRGGDGAYAEEAVVAAGQRWTTDQPFRLSVDPADFC